MYSCDNNFNYIKNFKYSTNLKKKNQIQHIKKNTTEQLDIP